MRNPRAASDTRHARTGKDGAFYTEDGVLIASVESFRYGIFRAHCLGGMDQRKGWYTVSAYRLARLICRILQSVT